MTYLRCSAGGIDQDIRLQHDGGQDYGVTLDADHQERIVTEKKELDEKIDKLDTFRAGQIFAGLPEDEQNRLNWQLSFMRKYSGVLADWIKAF